MVLHLPADSLDDAVQFVARWRVVTPEGEHQVDGIKKTGQRLGQIGCLVGLERVFQGLLWAVSDTNTHFHTYINAYRDKCTEHRYTNKEYRSSTKFHSRVRHCGLSTSSGLRLTIKWPSVGKSWKVLVEDLWWCGGALRTDSASRTMLNATQLDRSRCKWSEQQIKSPSQPANLHTDTPLKTSGMLSGRPNTLQLKKKITFIPPNVDFQVKFIFISRSF